MRPNATGTPASIPADGKNGVGWGPIMGDYWGYACWRCGSSISGTEFDQMTEFDIVFRQGLAPNSAQLYRLALHEFGHAFGLDHTQTANCPGAVMCPAANVGSLQPDDVAGGRALYGPAPTPTPPSRRFRVVVPEVA